MGYCSEANTIIGVTGTAPKISGNDFYELLQEYHKNLTYSTEFDDDSYADSDWEDVSESKKEVLVYFIRSENSIDMWGHSHCGCRTIVSKLSDLIPTKEEKDILMKVAEKFKFDKELKVVTKVSGG